MNKLLPLAIISFFLFCDQPTEINNNKTQALALSKDSLKVYNNSISSFMDLITINNNSEDSIVLDSAYLLVDIFDTTGLYGKIETHWVEHNYGDFKWYLKKTGENKYKLEKNYFSPNDTAVPLRFFPKDSCVLMGLRIGNYLVSSQIPKYSKYLKGSLQLYFSNNQIVNIRLYSDDLRN
jgi:hypothetical protein